VSSYLDPLLQRNPELNDTIYQLDIMDVYSIFHPVIAQCNSSHGTVYKVHHILGNKARLNKYKKIEMTPSILSDHNAIKLELNKSSSRK
jgi:hypothetical protein